MFKYLFYFNDTLTSNQIRKTNFFLYYTYSNKKIAKSSLKNNETLFKCYLNV